MAITLFVMFYTNDPSKSLLLRWLLAAMVFLISYGFMAGFFNAFIKASIEKSLIMDGVYDWLSLTGLFLVFAAVLIIVKLVVRRLLLLMPEQVMGSKILLGLSSLSLIFSIINHKAFNTASNFASSIFILAVIIGSYLTVKELNTKYH